MRLGLGILGLRQARVRARFRAKFRLRVLRWTAGLLAKVNEIIRLSLIHIS